MKLVEILHRIDALEKRVVTLEKRSPQLATQKKTDKDNK